MLRCILRAPIHDMDEVHAFAFRESLRFVHLFPATAEQPDEYVWVDGSSRTTVRFMRDPVPGTDYFTLEGPRESYWRDRMEADETFELVSDEEVFGPLEPDPVEQARQVRYAGMLWEPSRARAVSRKLELGLASRDRRVRMAAISGIAYARQRSLLQLLQRTLEFESDPEVRASAERVAGALDKALP